ncbi:MAG: YhcG family protein [Bacteroidota bacterium]|jgi:predicted nuclease of restriction endonuclease-like (RecB) superfamily
MNKSNREYKKWLSELKEKINSAQIKAALQLNEQLLQLYWELGEQIIKKLNDEKWGNSVVDNLSSDLQLSFPEIKGFSRRNLFYMKRWVEFYSSKNTKVQQAVAQIKNTIVQQAVAQLKMPIVQQAVAQIEMPESLMFSIPWGHHILIISKIFKVEEAVFYIQKTIENNWSRSVLLHQLDSNLYKRQIKNLKVSNFKKTLPKQHSDLANQILKDPYTFDFISLGMEANEREIEQSLTQHIAKFLVELGKGFAYVGKQYHLAVGNKDFYIDLLFYHLQLHSYVVIELKAKEFSPEHVGQISFYLNAVDAQVKSEIDNPTIGIIICKEKNRIIAEYALRNVKNPIGVSAYTLTQSIPKKLQKVLPTIEELESGFDKMEKLVRRGERKINEKEKKRVKDNTLIKNRKSTTTNKKSK